MRYRFADCVLDIERIVLWRDSEVVAVEPQVFSVLQYLVEHRGRVVSKAELLDGVWGDQFVSESALTSRISSARAAIGDDGTRQELLRTVHRRGYELVVDVTEEPIPLTSRHSEVSPSAPEVRDFPVAPTELIGRESELARLETMLSQSRVVSITGPGGIGKTRLAIAAGEAELHRRSDGVALVDLTIVVDGPNLVNNIGAALGLSLGADPVEAVLDYLRRSDLLLILDNCEHLVADVAAFVARFLSSEGSAVILTTTRQRLDLLGEHVLPLRPLGFDDADSPALALFEARAAALDPGFAITDVNRSAVRDLCRHLDGVPLAIELAAARTSVMSPGELLAAIDDRFGLIRGRRRPERHRTLEATLDWSYQLLEPNEQRLLDRLGVFAGSFDAAAVATVADLTPTETWSGLESLISKSLVMREPVTEPSRFRLLETTAHYAVERLRTGHSLGEVRDRHLNHYLGEADRYVAGAYADLAARSALSADRPNLVAAFEHGAKMGRWRDNARLLIHLGSVWYDNPSEGIALIERCLGQVSGPTALGLRLHQAFLHLLAGDTAALRLATERLIQCDEAVYRAFGLAVQGFTVERLDGGDGMMDIDRAHALLAELDDGGPRRQAEATCHALTGLVMLLREDFDAAATHAARAAEIHDDLGFVSEMLARALVTQAVCALVAGDHEAALEIADRYAATASGLGTGDEIKALAYLGLDQLELARGTARAHALRAAKGTVSRQATDSLLVLAAIDLAEGDADSAAGLLTTLGRCRQSELTAYSWHLADRLGVREALATKDRLTEPELKVLERRDLDRLKTELERRGSP